MITLSIESIVSNVWYYLCKGIASICDFIISFFPDNKMENISVPEEVAKVLGYVNYYLPIKQFIFIITGWLLCLIALMIYRLLAGFFKLVGGG